MPIGANRSLNPSTRILMKVSSPLRWICSLLCVTCSATAQLPFDGAFFFGDSLTDSGNLAVSTGGANPPSPPYAGGRFSSGPVYSEYLVSGLGLATTAAPSVANNLNFAFGGATAGAGSQSPTFPQQIGLFQQRQITPSPDAGFFVFFGANDILGPVQSDPAAQDPAVLSQIAGAAAMNVAGGIQSLVGLGAENVVVMTLPDLGKTSQVVGTAGETLLTIASGAFNQTLIGAVAGLQAGTRITVVDTESLLDAILENPALFGFSDTTSNALAAGALSPPQSENFVFFDPIHPTTTVHESLAGAVTEILNPEPALGAISQLGRTSLMVNQFTQDALDQRLSGLRLESRKGRDDAFLLNVEIGGVDGGLDATGLLPETAYDGFLVHIGADGRFGDNLFLGLGFSRVEVNGSMGGGAATFDMAQDAGMAYGLYHAGPLSLEGALGYADIQVGEVRRRTALSGLPALGETSGNLLFGNVKLALPFESERGLVQPFAGLRFVDGELDGFAESGVAALALQYGGQDVASTSGIFGAEAFLHGELDSGRPWLGRIHLAYQADFEDGGRAVTGGLANFPSPGSAVTAIDGVGDGFRLGLQGAMEVAFGLSLNLAYTADLRSDDATAHRFTLSFQNNL